HGILQHDFKTDIEAASKLFNLKSNTSFYQKIKNSLYHKLYESSLYVFDYSNNDEKKEHIQSIRAGFIIKNLTIQENGRLTIPLTEKYYNKFKKYNLHQEIIESSKALISYFGIAEPNLQKLKKYNADRHEAINQYYWEKLASHYYESINTLFNNITNINDEEVIKIIDSYIKELDQYKPSVNSQYFFKDYHSLKMIKYSITREYTKIVDECDEFLAFLKSLPFKSSGPRKFALKTKSKYLIIIGKFEEAIATLEELLKVEEVGSLIWLDISNTKILAYIHLQNYKQAYEETNQVMHHKSFPKIVSLYKRHIELKYIYIEIILLLNFDKDLKEDHLQRSIKRYLKQYPEFTKDKTVMNVPLFIAQLIDSIIRKEEYEILDRVEAIKKYSSRYIIKNKGTRSNCFINMLINVVKYQYHHVAINRHSQRYIKALFENPKDQTSEDAEIEIVPYEDLWRLLLQYLTDRKTKTNKK
ncbi:MAG: hypothetical protein RLZZ546_577, partial [Bacteroidota bacterium]